MIAESAVEAYEAASTREANSERASVPKLSCYGMLGCLFGHKFQARYEFAVVEAVTSCQYRCDVCVRCGVVAAPALRKEPIYD